MTDNFVPGVRQNFLVGSGGVRLAAANPADPLANLSLAFLGDPAYADGRAAATTDFLDAANGSYQQDAQRMRAAGYRDRAYGRAVTTGGKTWLQYWLFSYYNPQNVLGFGVHEGDWEFIQVGLDADGAPDVATYGQHDGGERCAVERRRQDGRGRAGGLRRPRVARVLLRAGREPARLPARRPSPRRRLPGGAGAGDRHPVDAVHGLAGQVGGVVLQPARAAPAGQVERAEQLQQRAGACTVGATQRSATARAQERAAEVPAPRISARRSGGKLASVRYRFARLGRDRATRPTTLLVAVAEAGAPDVATARRVRVRRRAGDGLAAAAAGRRRALRRQRERVHAGRLAQQRRPRAAPLSSVVERRAHADARAPLPIAPRVAGERLVDGHAELDALLLERLELLGDVARTQRMAQIALERVLVPEPDDQRVRVPVAWRGCARGRC